jgi:hypothetical protein
LSSLLVDTSQATNTNMKSFIAVALVAMLAFAATADGK